MAGMDWLPEAVQRAGSERTLRTGETLFRSGMRTAGLYQVLSGRVRLVRVNRRGREAVLYVATTGEILAEASLFSSTYHCDAIAMTNAVVRLFPKTAVLAALERDPKAALAFMATLAGQIMALRMRIEQRNIRSAHDRLRHYLSMNVNADGRTVALTGTLKDLASELGLTHEALYRALAELAKRGEIKRSKDKIRITAQFAL
jgi:CRP-like cAMP-binding protein